MCVYIYVIVAGLAAGQDEVFAMMVSPIINLAHPVGRLALG